MKITIFAPRRFARPLLLALVGLASIGSILATSVPGEPFQSTSEMFLLVYTGGDGEAHTRVSRSGLDWRDADPDGMPEMKYSGYILVPDAAVAITNNELDQWIGVFTSPHGGMALTRYHPTRSFQPPPIILEGPLYIDRAGRPSIARFGDRLVIAWLRGEGPRYDLVTVVGIVRGEKIELAEPVVFKRGALQAAAEAMAGGTTFKDGVVADPALSHGLNGSFLMAVVRETWEDVQARSRGEESPVRYRVAIHESENGRDWWMHSTIHDSEMPVGPGSVVAIAGFTDSTAIVAAVSGEEGEPAQIAVARYCLGPLWYEQDAQAVFGGRPLADRPIALVSLGEPKPIPPGGYLDCVENRATATPAP